MAPDSESRSENARRQASPIAMFLAGLLLVAAYPLSPPFVFAVCYLLGVDFGLIRDTVYAPLLVVANHAPWVIAPLEAYCEFVIWMLRIPKL
jgi:hypothetical protein